MLKQLCLEKFIDSEREIDDSIVDDVSTESDIQKLIPKELIQKSSTTDVFSGKGKAKGMKVKEFQPPRIHSSIENLNKSMKTKKLSCLEYVTDTRVLNILFSGVETIPQLLKVIDRIVVKPQTKEFCRCEITKTLERLDDPYFGQSVPFVCIRTNDHILFIETTPRALVFAKETNVGRLSVLHYDGRYVEIDIGPSLWRLSRDTPVDVEWSRCGRYIFVSVQTKHSHIYDTLLGKLVKIDEKNDNFHDLTQFPVSFLYTNVGRVLGAYNTGPITKDVRYWFRGIKVYSITVGIVDKNLQNHQKFIKIMGIK